jgi:acyl-CoA reductase-like NAD-dependent aldehyde dehydrogenase
MTATLEQHTISNTINDISIDEASALLQRQRAYFDSGATREIAVRKRHLQNLYDAIKSRKNEILQALYDDFRKPAFEGYVTEVGFVLEEISHTIKHLSSWARPKRVSVPLVVQPASAHVHSVPFGVTLVISPWNYPFQLLFAPIVGAIAAGNTVVMKPSELAPATSHIAKSIIEQVFPSEFVAVVEGGVATNQNLLNLKWDYIFFTGGTEVGRIVAIAAAKHLTPTTLELGGKSPCIVDKTANLDVAVRRVVWGKFVNAGQTCVAPDYLLLDTAVEQEFLAKVKTTIQQFYGANPKQSPDFARIINDRHFTRLAGYLGDGDIFTGGDTDADERYIAPTVLLNASSDAPVMRDEIFGPILPVVPYSRLDDALDFINNRSKPLALYVFSEQKNIQERVLTETVSGGGCVNDTLTHLVVPGLPFGGVGDSGIGGYHGKHSFDTFSHKRSILNKPNALDITIRYAPYGEKVNMMKHIIG